MLYLSLTSAIAWNKCTFPTVKYFALDEGPGISYTYALAAANGNMYSGGYTKGNFAFIGIKPDGTDITPTAGAPLWGQTTSDVQSLYISETNADGKMTKGWKFQGSAIQKGQIGHGKQTNDIDGHSGMHMMQDKKHIAVKGGFRQILWVGDEMWSSASPVRINTNDQVPFVMSLQTDSNEGVGAGTTGWAKEMDKDKDSAGGATIHSVDGDAEGNMIVSYKGCSGFDAKAKGKDAYGRTIEGATTGCKEHISKLMKKSAKSSQRTTGFVPYFDYKGALAVSGWMTLTTGEKGGTSTVFEYDLKGTDPTCNKGPAAGVANSCGIHIHSGKTCSADAGGYYFKKGLSDPWTNVIYSPDSNGNAANTFGVTVDTGMTAKDLVARAFIVHDRTGARIGCTQIANAGGEEYYKKTLTTSLSACRTTTETGTGYVYCGFTLSGGAAAATFGKDAKGKDITVAADAKKTRVGVVKFSTAALVPVWAKLTALEGSFSDLAVSRDGALLAVIASDGYGKPGKAARIDTSTATAGAVLWEAQDGVGTHGWRGIEVNSAASMKKVGAVDEVLVFGQVNAGSPQTITDAAKISTTINSRGSYEVYLAAYRASDGVGLWAQDGGGTGMEYFFAMASDPDSGAVYVGGTTRSEHIRWGDISRKNVMYNGQPGKDDPDRNSAVGSSKALTVKIDSLPTVASCLKTCNNAFPLQASDVKAGYCYIDRHCYADGTASPYKYHECTKCDAAANPLAWSAPSTEAHCYIGGKCLADGTHKQVAVGRSMKDDPCMKCDHAKNKTDYSAVAGCALGTFKAACYTENGTEVVSLDEMEKQNTSNHATIHQMTETMLAKNTEVASLKNTRIRLSAEASAAKNLSDTYSLQILGLTGTVNTCTANLLNCGSIDDGLAVALIVVMSVMFGVVLLILCIVIQKEKKGTPIFMPVPVPASPAAKI